MKKALFFFAFGLALVTAGCNRATEASNAQGDLGAVLEQAGTTLARQSGGSGNGIICVGGGRTFGCACVKGSSNPDLSCAGMEDLCRSNGSEMECEVVEGAEICSCGFTIPESGSDDDGGEGGPASDVVAPTPAPLQTGD